MSQILLLGIDLGTTSIKIVLVDSKTNLIVEEAKADTKAQIPQSDALRNEQNVTQIFYTVNSLLATFSPEHMRNVRYIGISGQMHGVVLWKKSQVWNWTENSNFSVDASSVSTLVTWQDGRCTPDFLSTLPDSPDGIHTGFGIPTLFWMQKFEPEKLDSFYHSGTIHDLLVSILTNNNNTEKPVMTPQNAASWGYYDSSTGNWSIEKLKEADFPINYLPRIIDAESVAGTLYNDWHGIPTGTKIGAALGDMQASIYSTLFDKPLDGSAFLNVSTSIQLSFVLPKDTKLVTNHSNHGVEIREYFFGRSLAVAAALTGGNCLYTFVKMLSSWTQDLGVEIDEDTIWKKLLIMNGNDTKSDLIVDPTLLGERNCPMKKAAVTNIHPNNLQLGQFFRAICRGLVTNTEKLMPQDILLKHGIETIYGSGSALLRNPILQEELRKTFSNFHIVVCEGGDSAVGSALLGKKILENSI